MAGYSPGAGCYSQNTEMNFHLIFTLGDLFGLLLLALFLFGVGLYVLNLGLKKLRHKYTEWKGKLHGWH